MMFRSGLGGQAAILFSARSALVLILNWVQLLHMTDECVSKDNNNNNNFDHSHHHDEDVVFCVLMSIHKLVGIKIILDHSLCELLLLWFLYHSIHLLTSKRLWTVLDPDLAAAAPAERRADCWGGAEEKNLYVLNQLTLFYIQRMNSSSILEIKNFFCLLKSDSFNANLRNKTNQAVYCYFKSTR